MDPDLRDYYVALADRDYGDLDLWKAYWYVIFVVTCTVAVNQCPATKIYYEVLGSLSVMGILSAGSTPKIRNSIFSSSSLPLGFSMSLLILLLYYSLVWCPHLV